MRTLLPFATVAAAVAVCIVTAPPVFAGGLDHLHHGHVRGDDPYAYQPAVPPYYGYRNSGYWVPAEQMRTRYRRDLQLPPYAASWGWNSRKWSLAHGDERREFTRDWRR